MKSKNNYEKKSEHQKQTLKLIYGCSVVEYCLVA